MHPIAHKIQESYVQRTPQSLAYHRFARQYMPGGDTRTITYFEPHPLYMRSGEGPRLTDVDGNVYLDFLGNYTSQIHGYGHPAIVEAISTQAAQGTAFGANAPAQTALAEELCRRLPSLEKVRFCNSGTEATLNAIRAARAFTGRDKIVKIEGGYHGSHDWVEVSVAPPLDEAGPAQAPHPVPDAQGIPAHLLDDVLIMPFNHFEAASALFDKHGNQLAALIIEPLLGATGTIPAEDGYLQHLRDLCDVHGTLLIFDEVISFRLDFGGLQTLYEVKPDLTALGKIIGGGLPVGAFGGRSDIMDLFAPPNPRLTQSGTYNANPLTMAAGLACLQLLPHEEIRRINQLGARLATGLQNALDEMRIAGKVTGLGSLHTLHFTWDEVRDYRSMATSPPELSRLTHLGLINRGVFTAKRNMFVVSTPMDEADVDACVAAFADTLGDLRDYVAEELPDLAG